MNPEGQEKTPVMPEQQTKMPKHPYDVTMVAKDQAEIQKWMHGKKK